MLKGAKSTVVNKHATLRWGLEEVDNRELHGKERTIVGALASVHSLSLGDLECGLSAQVLAT